MTGVIDNLREFYTSIAQNRSLERLVISGYCFVDACEIIEILLPLLEHNSTLFHLGFHDFKNKMGDNALFALSSALKKI